MIGFSFPSFASEMSLLSLVSARQKPIAIKKQSTPATIQAMAKKVFLPPSELFVDRKKDLVPPNVETTNSFQMLTTQSPASRPPEILPQSFLKLGSAAPLIQTIKCSSVISSHQMSYHKPTPLLGTTFLNFCSTSEVQAIPYQKMSISFLVPFSSY